MSADKLSTLQHALNLKKKELAMIEAIDEIRDTAPDPPTMLNRLASLLMEQLEATLCLFFLQDREANTLELKALTSRGDELAPLVSRITAELAERAFQLPDTTAWRGEEALPGAGIAGLQFLAAPIIMGEDDRLGAILLARIGNPFGPDEVQLLKTAENQIDSAVIQSHIYDRLELSKRELDLIYRMDNIRDQDLPLDDMLNVVIQEATAALHAEAGFVMLYDRAEKELEMRASTAQDLLPTLPHYPTIRQAINDALKSAEVVCHNFVGDGGQSVMCLPLILNERIIGVLGVVNSRKPHGFTAADRRLLQAIGSQIDTAIYERREIRQLRRVLGRSVDPRVMERLLSNPDVEFLKGELLELTVLYADIRGSTRLAEMTEPGTLVEFIKDYLSRMTEVVLAYEGTVDKFVGDEVMALFGAPMPQEDHALRAVRVGLEMQTAHRQIQEAWRERGLDAPPIGVGIATGQMIAGEMGGALRTDYTVIGRAANLGARICSAAKGGQVLISQRTYDLARHAIEVVPIPGQRFKGVGEVTVYDVRRIVE